MRGHIKKFQAAGVAAIAVLAMAACGDDSGDTDSAGEATGTVTVSDAWSRQPANGQSTTAVYLVVSNGTDEDITIESAASPASDRVELHETIANDDGTMQMREEPDGFVVPAQGEFTFESGGPHIMFFDIDAASYPTDSVEVTLQFDSADPLTFDAEVRAIAGGDMDMDHDDMDDMDDMDSDDGN